MKKALIIANGDPVSKRLISKLKSNGYNYITCADGGANTLRKTGLYPDAIVGDFDSVTKENLDYFREYSEIIRLERQDDTDVDKSLKILISKGFSRVILLGATGDRMDHTICNIGIVLKYFDEIKVLLIHRKSILTPYTGEAILNTVPGETISFYGFDSKVRISGTGLYYPLQNCNLNISQSESTSNVATGNNVNLMIDNGVILVIRDLKLVLENDFLS